MTANGYANKIGMLTTLKKLSTPISTQIVSSTPGRMRLRVAQPHRQSGEMERIINTLKAHPQIDRVQMNPQHGSILIHHAGENGSLNDIFATLKDLGLIFGGMTPYGKSQTAAGVTNAVVDLNQRVVKATDGVVDLRVLFPLGLGVLAMRQLLVKGLQFDIIPWYVLAWYTFDSFIKLNGTTNSTQKES